jgi:sugar O-acyltransferase (sialic acid O-acetyltransferase NeuD family)
MDSTTPNVFLGFSSSVLSLLLESLARVNPGSSVLIVENMEAKDDDPFLPASGIEVKRVRLEDWKFERGKQRLLFSSFNVRAKTGTFSAFAEAKGIREDDFGTLLSQGASVASTVELGRGCYLEPGTVVSPFTKLGFGVSVNRGVTIGHHTTIGSFSCINPGSHVAGHCRVGDRVTIGMGAVVFDGIEICEGSVIGGGSVVTKNVPPRVVAFGNPCKVVKEIASE